MERLLTCDREADLAAVCAGVPEFGAVLRDATEQGVAGILLARLSAAGFASQVAVARFERERLAGRLRARWLEETLAAALRPLNAGGVRAAVLKGPLLARRLYDDPSLRPSVDIDLLVAEHDLDRALVALEGGGFEQEPDSPRRRYFRTLHHHLHLQRKGSAPLELHFHAHRGFGQVLRSAPLLGRARPGSGPEGTRVYVLAPEDELLYLAVHGAGHLFARLLWLLDLKQAVARWELDWELLARRAREGGYAGVLGFALEELRRRLGVATPDLGLPKAGARLELVRRIRDELGFDERTPSTTAGILSASALLCDGSRPAWRYLSANLARVARRRVQRHFPGLAPEEWWG